MSDLEILNGIKEGKPEFENLLFEKYDQKIRFIVYSKLNLYREFAVDLIQDIKISVLMSIRNGNFKFESELSLGAYIYGISIKKISDFVRKAGKDNEYRESQLKSADKVYVDKYNMEEEELKNIVRKALKSLKSKYQEVLYLKFFDELSVKEISDQLKLPPRRVSERINYALKLVKKQIGLTHYFK